MDSGPGGLGRIHPARLRRPGAARPASGTTGRSASGTAAARVRPGARPPGGRWGCSSRPTGRRAGSSPTCRRTVEDAGPRRCCAASSSSSGAVERARAYVTSHGLYELHLNGQPRGRPALHARLDELQQAPAVPDLRRDAAPEDGRQRRGRAARQRLVPRQPRLGRPPQHLRRPPRRCSPQIEVTYKDGRERDRSRSDGDWKAATGPILMSEIYHGETYDARLEKAGWTAPGFDDQRVGRRRRSPITARTISSRPPDRPSRRIQELQAGQDLQDAGRRHGRRHGPEHGRLGAAARAGARGHDGDAAPRRGARQGRQLLHREPAQGAGDRCTTRSRAAATRSSSRTSRSHGFRYVEVDGYPGRRSRPTT